MIWEAMRMIYLGYDWREIHGLPLQTHKSHRQMSNLTLEAQSGTIGGVQHDPRNRRSMGANEMKRIYVASSWRNESQKGVVTALRKFGHSVYDFKNPAPSNKGFHWSEIDKNWKSWSIEAYRASLMHPIAKKGFELDFSAMQWADTFVGVMPFGRSASMEMGWAAGNGKRTILLLSDAEPELMVKMFDHICLSLDEVISLLGTLG